MSDHLEDKSPSELTEEEIAELTTATFDYGPSLNENLPEPKPVCIDADPPNEWLYRLGSLEVLPVEIQQSILESLDIVSLANFRLVNRRADLLFRAIPEYRWIVTKFAKLLLAIQCIGTGRWTTYNHLFCELHRSDCENCGDFAPWLYLLTCRRVCYLCFTNKDKYFPLRLHRAHQIFAISESMLLDQPHMSSVHGEYSYLEQEFRHRRLLVDRHSAYKTALKIHGSKEEMDRAALQLQYKEQQSWPELKAKAAVRGRWRERGHMNDMGISNPFRFTAIMSTPWVNKEEQRLEWGVHCPGCRNYTLNPGLHYQRKYSIKGFREHLARCGNLYKLKDGTFPWRHRGQLPPAGWAE